MPNRIIKESICTSENIDMLTSFQETVFYRLIVNCDDFGRLDARPKILAAKLFPLKEIRASQMEEALRALTSAELVSTYEVDGKPFLQMNTWERHQQTRATKSKYPAPDGSYTKSNDINGNHLISDDSKCSRNRNRNRNREIENENGIGGNARAREDQDTTTTDDSPFSISDQEIGESLARDQRIESAAQKWGLKLSEGIMLKCRDWCRECSLEWLLKAIEKAGQIASPSWNYVWGIMENAKAAGSFDTKGGSSNAFDSGNYGREHTGSKYGLKPNIL